MNKGSNLREGRDIRFIASYIFLFFISVYLLTSTDNNIYHTDASQVRYEVTRSIMERLDLSIPDGLGVRGSDGREYSWFGIGQSVVAIPFYIAAKALGANPENGVAVINQLVGAATVVLIFLFSASLGYTKGTSLFVALLYGLGTMAWPLSKQPFDHVIETFFVLLSVYFLSRYIEDKKSGYLIMSAISTGFAFITRPTSILTVPPLFIMLIIHYSRGSGFKSSFRPVIRNIALFSIAFLPFLSLSLWYNYYRFGSIFETGYSLIASRSGIDFFTGVSLFTGLAGFLISPGKGFFYYSPVAVLFFFSIKPFIRRHFELLICFVCIMLFYLLFLSKNIFWHGDFAWGPRYVFALTPFFIIPLAAIFNSDQWMKKRFMRMAAYFLLVISLIIQIAAVSVDFQKYFHYLHFEKGVRFVEVFGEGSPPIVEPPAETYFEWKKSPILAQFGFIFEIAGKIKDYKYLKPPDDMPVDEIIKASPYYNVFDFWWIYKYFLEGSYSGFIVAFALLLTASYSALRLWKAVT